MRLDSALRGRGIEPVCGVTEHLAAAIRERRSAKPLGLGGAEAVAATQPLHRVSSRATGAGLCAIGRDHPQPCHRAA